MSHHEKLWKKKCSKSHNLSELGIFCVQIPGLGHQARRVKFKLAMHMFLTCRLVTCYPSSWSAGHLAIFHIQKIPHCDSQFPSMHFSHSSYRVDPNVMLIGSNRLAAKVTLAKLFLDLLLLYSSIGQRHPRQDLHAFFKTLRKNRHWRDIICIKLPCQSCPYLTRKKKHWTRERCLWVGIMYDSVVTTPCIMNMYVRYPRHKSNFTLYLLKSKFVSCKEKYSEHLQTVLIRIKG